MLAIAFDFAVAESAVRRPKGVSQACADIGGTPAGFGFERVRGSPGTAPSEDLANLSGALKALPWPPAPVRDIRAFRVEQWPDFKPKIDWAAGDRNGACNQGSLQHSEKWAVPRCGQNRLAASWTGRRQAVTS